MSAQIQLQMGILPCPFCGETDTAYSGIAQVCQRCGAQGPEWQANEADAIASWNRRADSNKADQPAATGKHSPMPFLDGGPSDLGHRWLVDGKGERIGLVKARGVQAGNIELICRAVNEMAALKGDAK